MKISTRFLLVWALLLIQFSTLAATVTISVGDNFYSPQAVTIRPGDVVTWQYVGQQSHPTASDNGAWVTFPMNSTATTKSLTFNTLGNFPYHCTIHGGSGGAGMAGVITVSNATPVDEARPATPTLSVYPNPAKGSVMVSLSQKAGADYKLRLSNIIGREVRSVALKPDFAGEAVSVNLADLPAGIYFYSLIANGKVLTTKRLVLQN
ncbi:T9SS type A sorting domain-containing protein [Hymenobacter persicinus]|uniref:T9SS type A sorting domain-containing protein n=1 Tax=Hymenobacter persicinus TaxID=2025506 RepID=A0A4Q5L8I8_9BACT|nr:T9SS type A sorting domain-containing protein [Hymenobacter persicinus]RYU77947.1 T9SS type A sorting domain-containing protein [Hymenobacter persicinus]